MRPNWDLYAIGSLLGIGYVLAIFLLPICIVAVGIDLVHWFLFERTIFYDSKKFYN